MIYLIFLIELEVQTLYFLLLQEKYEILLVKNPCKFVSEVMKGVGSPINFSLQSKNKSPVTFSLHLVQALAPKCSWNIQI